MGAVVGLSINPEIFESGKSTDERNQRFLLDLFRLTFYQQPQGQKYGGLATLRQEYNPEDPILVRTHRGLFRPSFEHDLKGYREPLGLGHISDYQREPYYLRQSAFPPFTICFAGNLQNCEEIISDFTKKGKGFERDDDVVLICHLIIEADWNEDMDKDSNFLKGIAHMTEKIKGSFSLVILTEDRIYATRGLDAHEPLFLGRKKGAVAVVSDTTGFGVQGFEFDQMLKPGEVVVLRKGVVESIGSIEIQRKIACQLCSFKGVYSFGPCSMATNKLDAATVRRRTGAALAKRDIESNPPFIPHIAFPIPESGRFHYIGYKGYLDMQFMLGDIPYTPLGDEFLTRFSFAFRSYTLDVQEERDIEAEIKIVPVVIFSIPKELLQYWLDKNFVKRTKNNEIIIDVVVVDDSIVRGTQSTNNLIPKTMSIKIQTDISGMRIITKIHFRIANPKLLSACRWGKTTRTTGELIAPKDRGVRSDEEIAEMLGIESCRFNTIEDVAAAHEMPKDQLCFDCARVE